MGVRKFKADRIFDGYQFHENAVLITDEKGRIIDLVREEHDEVQVVRGFLSPGFINCHCHLELSHMRGHIPTGTGLVDFVLKVVKERHFAENEITQAIESAEMEMLQNGIVAVGDICNNTSTYGKKKEAKIAYHNFIESSGWLPQIWQKRLGSAEQLLQTFSTLSQPASIVPHAPYSVSENLWEGLEKHFKGSILTMHNQESQAETEWFKNGNGDFLRLYQQLGIRIQQGPSYGISSLQHVFPKMKEADKLILVHNTFIKEENINFMNEEQRAGMEIFLCLCPNANRYIENTLPPIDLFRKHRMNLVLGTDSLASNHQLSILEEMKTILLQFPDISMEECLTWATSNGAKALGMNENLGSFEKGKKPGVLRIDAEHWQVERLL